jgi:hypothetical protein
MALTASSKQNRSRNADARRYTMPATTPTTIAAHGSITPQLAVIAAKPERHPFMAVDKLKTASPVILSV